MSLFSSISRMVLSFRPSPEERQAKQRALYDEELQRSPKLYSWIQDLRDQQYDNMHRVRLPDHFPIVTGFDGNGKPVWGTLLPEHVQERPAIPADDTNVVRLKPKPPALTRQ